MPVQNFEQRVAEVFTQEELMAMVEDAKARGLPPRNLVEHRLLAREQQVTEAVGEINRDPTFQGGLASQQLGGAKVDMTDEALGPVQAASLNASPVVGGRGRASTPEGRVEDLKATFGEGYEVKLVSIPNIETGQQRLVEMVKEPGSDTFVPANRPGPSMADIYELGGDLLTFEGAMGMVPLGKAGQFGAQVLKRGAATAAGAGADVALDDEEAQTDALVARIATGGLMGVFGEALTTGSMAIINAGGGRSGRTGRLGDKALDRALAYEELRTGKARAFEPLGAGQTSPNTFGGIIRRRLSQYSPALKEQVIQQRRALAKPLQEEVNEFLSMDGLDQLIMANAYSPEALRAIEQKMRQELQQETLSVLGVPAEGVSRSRAGRTVQKGLFDIRDKKGSYRMIVQARQREGRERLSELTKAKYSNGPNAISFDISDALVTLDEFSPQVWAGIKQRTEGAIPGSEVPTPLSGRGIPSAKGTEHVAVIQKQFQDDLGFVVDVLKSLDNPSRMRTDRFVTLNVPGKDGQKVPVNLNSFDLIQNLRGHLSNYYGNEFLRGTQDAVVAKQLYDDLGRALERPSGPNAGEFIREIKTYNKNSSNMHQMLDDLEGVRLATQPDPQGVVDAFVDGRMGFRTARALKDGLVVAGDRGHMAFQQYKDSATRTFIQNPEKIANLRRMDPQTARTMYSEKELEALDLYSANMKLLNDRQFSRTISDAGDARGRAKSLFTGATDDEFQRIWRAATEDEKVAMRVSIVEDLLRRSSGSALGETALPNGNMLSNNLNEALNGPLATRYRQVLPKSTIEAMQDTEFASAFLNEVAGISDTGSAIAASEAGGKLLSSAFDGVTAVVEAFGGARALNFAANSLADGWLARVMRPQVKQPWNPAKTLAITRGAVTTVNSLQAQADSAESLARKAEALRLSRENALTRVR